MVVFADRPDALRVRLDGPVEARIAQVMALGIDENKPGRAAGSGQRPEAYARVFFNARQDDHRLYHLIIDSTILSSTPASTSSSGRHRIGSARSRVSACLGAAARR